MSGPLKNVVLVGAGGNLGPSILKALLDKNFNVTILARAESKSTFPSGVKVTKGDYTPEFLESALRGQDAVISTIASNVLDSQKAIIDAAVKVGVKRILPSEFGSDSARPAAVKAVPFYQAKLDILEYIKEAVKSHPETTWTALVTGPFFDWVLENEFWGFNVAQRNGILYDNGLAKFDTTTLPTVGAAVTSLLSNPDKFQNERVYISSFTISQAEILQALKTATGDTNWDIKEESAQAFYDEGHEKLKKGDFMGIINLIMGSTYQKGKGADYSSFRTLRNEDLGLKKEELLEVVKEVLERKK